MVELGDFFMARHGTPPEHKRFVLAESGHFVPRPTLIPESLDWLDRYLGPVEGN